MFGQLDRIAAASRPTRGALSQRQVQDSIGYDRRAKSAQLTAAPAAARACAVARVGSSLRGQSRDE
eukprot:3345081-Lingulodinium_polyedra.AAC.1